MATPLKPMYPTLVHTEKASAASTATTGNKLSYTVPSGRATKVLASSMLGTTGNTQVCTLQVVLGGVTINVQAVTGSGIVSWVGWLAAGDQVIWNCTTAVALSVTDLTITCEDYEVQ